MKTKICSRCKAPKPRSDYYDHPQKSDGKRGECKSCCAEWLREHRAKKKSQGEESDGQITRLRLKMEVLRVYSPQGPTCACCGEDRHEFLSIDHIKGGGHQHRKTFKGTLYAWLKRNGYPSGFRVLCHNCNQSFGAYGYCPHQTTQRRVEKPHLTDVVQGTILDAASKLAADGIYPSEPKVAAMSGHKIAVVHRHKTILMKNGTWPMLEQAIQSARRYRPDIYKREVEDDFGKRDV